MRRRVERRALPAGGAALPAHLHPVLARVYRARHLDSAADLDPSLGGLAPWRSLRDIERAVALLLDALEHRRRILVVGDFDADGATSCAIAVRGLRLLGAGDVGYLVPDRFRFGYGLTPEIVQVAAEREPHLLITVDNGVSSIEGVAAARALGMHVLVTDHHLPGERLPAADALVDPNQAGCAFPSKALAGCGVMFYVLIALRAAMRDAGWFAGRAEPNLACLLDLVALGTVADVVALDRNNRILVEQGLRRIRSARAQPGVSALLRVAGRDPGRAIAADLGFAAGPRLNAAGRLSDMALGIECLLADDPGAAESMARELDRLNRERRDIEAEMRARAEELLSRMHLEERGLPYGMCLFDARWHQGVIGILAARVREQVHRPVIAFAPHGEGLIKGSARSIPGLHVRDVLAAVAGRHPDLLHNFGGHAMAAGLSLAAEDFERFAHAFDAQVRAVLDDDLLVGRLWSDGELHPGEIDLALAEALRLGGPWGQGFPEPVFDGVFGVAGSRVVGEKHLKLRLYAHGGGREFDAIAFNAAGDFADVPPTVRAAYRLDVNEYQGVRRLQLVVEHLEGADPP